MVTNRWAKSKTFSIFATPPNPFFLKKTPTRSVPLPFTTYRCTTLLFWCVPIHFFMNFFLPQPEDEESGFRRFFNAELQPLMRQTEKRRKQLMAAVVVSGLCIFGLLVVGLKLGFFAIDLFLIIPVVGWYYSVTWIAHNFKAHFKRTILQPLLTFVHHGHKYFPKDKLPLDTFRKSGIFMANPFQYSGEDYVRGQVDEVVFEICELDVQHISYRGGELREEFKGLFYHATLPDFHQGQLIVLPKSKAQWHTKAIRRITRHGGKRFNPKNKVLDKHFVIYAWPGTHLERWPYKPFLNALSELSEQRGMAVYGSMLEHQMYVALEEPRNALEPYFWNSNLGFEDALRLYKDLKVLSDFAQRLR